jgi:enoyl-CoA hydratase/carnithine racemase
MPLNTEKRSRVTFLTIDRPPLNVLDIALLRDLDRELSACAADTATDILVVRGAGTRAFSAGVDIRDHTKERVPEMLDIVHQVIRRLLALPQVTIAAVAVASLQPAATLLSLRKRAHLPPRRFMWVAIRRSRWRVSRA